MNGKERLLWEMASHSSATMKSTFSWPLALHWFVLGNIFSTMRQSNVQHDIHSRCLHSNFFDKDIDIGIII